MLENSLHSILGSSFARTDKESWKKNASQEVDGKDPFEILSWETADGLRFFPYYDKSDLANDKSSVNFRLPVSNEPFLGPRAWICSPQIHVEDEKTANKISIDHLLNGADGVFYSINGSTDIGNLLSDVDWPYCALFFSGQNEKFVSHDLHSYLKRYDLSKQNISGGLFWEQFPKKDAVEFYAKNTPSIKSLGLAIPSSTPIKEIAFALTESARFISSLDAPDDVRENFFKSIAFSIQVDNDFLSTIAKLKALRMLWYQVARAFGANSYLPSDLLIHATTSVWISERFEPHGNMLKCTTAAMAAIFGGCNALTISPQDPNHATQSRIARNVSNILREESHLNKVSDPLQGAYAIEVMTEQFAKAAWKEFQSNFQ